MNFNAAFAAQAIANALGLSEPAECILSQFLEADADGTPMPPFNDQATIDELLAAALISRLPCGQLVANAEELRALAAMPQVQALDRAARAVRIAEAQMKQEGGEG
jgi:hypothetical protein